MNYEELQQKIEDLEAQVVDLNNRQFNPLQVLKDVKEIKSRNEQRELIDLSLINAKIVSGTTHASAGTESSHAHLLRRTPKAILILSKTNGYIYQSKAPDSTYIYLKGSANSMSFDALCIL
jgi:hypothetical protein